MAADPRFAQNQARVQNRDALAEELEPRFAEGTVAEWVARLETSGIPAGRINDVASALRPFYRTASLPCPYLDGKIERKLITEISGRDSYAFYNELSRAGFRRSHHLAYRPACAGCAACLPVRVAVRLRRRTRR